MVRLLGRHSLTYFLIPVLMPQRMTPTGDNFFYKELNFLGWDSVLKCLSTPHMNALGRRSTQTLSP